tara:strand:- start:3090 stop:3194 length:105 start_codon:yes stop_codon:yes gene_type:complete
VNLSKRLFNKSVSFDMALLQTFLDVEMIEFGLAC